MDAVEVAKKLIKIDTRNPPGDVSQAIDFLEKLFSSYKTKVYEKNGRKNLIVYISKGDKTLMLTSHLDVVPCDDTLLNPIVVNGKLYGRGSCDAKGCVAAICEASMIEAECGLKLAFTADEEVGGSNGLKQVFEAEKADAVLIAEPTGCDCVHVLQACVLAVDLTFKGEDGHTASKDACEGAIFRASKYILERTLAFRELKGNYENYKEFFSNLGVEFKIKSWEAVFNPSIINGGIKRNVVAPECKLSADIRFAPWIEIKKVLDLLSEKDVEFKVSGYLPPYGIFVDKVPLNDDLRFLRILFNAISSEDLKPKAAFSLGVGDSRHIRKHGTACFYLGPGGGNLHGKDEFIYISELKKAVSIYRKIISAFRTF